MVGIDPGQHTGIIALDVAGASVQGSRYLSHAVMNVTTAKSLTHAERDANLCDRIADFLRPILPVLVVLEEPFDAAISWRGNRHQRRGTAARLGTYYGLAVAACHRAAPTARLVSYPVTATNGRMGWMHGKRREHVLADAMAAGRVVGFPEVLYSTDQHGDIHDTAEHLFMALGVLIGHLARGPDPLARTALDV